MVQQASLLAVTTMIARALGPAALGRYVLAYALFTLLSLFSLLGFRYAVIRQVTAHVADGNAGAVRATIRLALLVSGTVALGLAGVLALFSSSLADLFHDGDLRLGFVLVAAALPACVTRDLSLAATQGWRSQRAFTIVAWVVEPVLRLVGTAVALFAGFGVPGALVALLVASWVSAGLGVRALRHRLRAFPGVRTAVPWRPLVAFAVTSWATVVAATGLVWVDTLLLGGLAAAADVGTYNVATRLVGLAVFVMAPIDTLFAPHFAHLYHVDDRPRLRATYTAATNWTLRLSVPAFVLLAVFPGDLLALFGPGFVVGATVTFVLAWGQLVNAATGPCGSLLVMSGANRTNMIDNVAALILNIVLNLVLIPPYGIVGAGIRLERLARADQPGQAVPGASPARRGPLRPGHGPVPRGGGGSGGCGTRAPRPPGRRHARARRRRARRLCRLPRRHPGPGAGAGGGRDAAGLRGRRELAREGR